MKSHLVISFCCLLLFSFCTLGYADEYYVYGAFNYGATTYPETWKEGYNPEDYGHVLLGTGSTTLSSKTFSGSYDYYIITVYPGTIVEIDAIKGSDGQYFSANYTGNTIDYQNVAGVPDGACASVGGEFEGGVGGFVTVNTSSHNLSSITVYTCSGSSSECDFCDPDGDGRTTPRDIRAWMQECLGPPPADRAKNDLMDYYLKEFLDLHKD